MEVFMFVVTGATGHTGSVVAKTLLKKGARVRVIGRSPDRLKNLTTEGAEPFDADLTDAAAVAKAMAGAKAAYVMIPPNISSSDVLGYQKRVVDSLASALKAAGVGHVVTLSSVGADKAERTGPVVGLHYLEQQLNSIDGLNVLHLRAGYFMENTLGQAAAVQKMGTTVGPLRADLKLPMIATRDIGEAAANALFSLDFRQKQTRELLGQRDLTMAEATQIIGKAIGKSDLKYAQLPDEQVKPALMQMGMSANMADLILEMSAALNSGHMRGLEPRSAKNSTPTSYETFVAEELVPLYQQASKAA
jgi:uncharacterized protein YbjT (DUF2867 family)